VAGGSALGPGVPFDSEASGAGALMTGVDVGAGEAVGEGSEMSWVGGLNLFSRWGARRRMTILLDLLLLLDLAEDF
jgi:hypothetical protein